MKSNAVKITLNIVFIISMLLTLGGIFNAGAWWGAEAYFNKMIHAQTALFHLVPGLIGLIGCEWYFHKHKN